MTEGAPLKDFIANAIDDICDAVESARRKHHYVAPEYFTDPNKAEKASIVNFDVAVTVNKQESETGEQSAKAGGGFKISVVQFGAAIDDKVGQSAEKSTSTVTRMQFSVPIYFQFSEEKRQAAIKAREEEFKRELPTNPQLA